MKKSTFLMAALLCGAWCATAQNTENGHEYVDLGLPSGTKWATCNVGATAPEGYGGYYAWGETTTKDTYSWGTYKWCSKGTYDSQTKYCTNSAYGTVDSKRVLDPEDDAAHVNWGGAWRMPTDAEWTELRENCTWTWTTLNGINGYEVKSKKEGNDNSIFLSAASTYGESSITSVGTSGNYWSNALYTNAPSQAYYVYFDSQGVSRKNSYRLNGRSVRPVLTTYSITLTAENGTVTGTGVYPQGTEVTLTATPAEDYHFVQWSDGNTENPRTITINANVELTAKFAANPVYYNAVGGLFSVGVGRQIKFAAGNLQYIQNTATWAFATYQYDMRGAANVENSALANKIDLFGWSGSNNTAPWGVSISTDYNNYSGDFVDWGQKIGDGNIWRTLSIDEWTYLLATRTDAANLMGIACIQISEEQYAYGLILLPDTWSCPEDITFTAGMTGNYKTNTFNLEQWAQLEAAGAVFLPAAGYRYGVNIERIQDNGLYWSASAYDSNNAYHLQFTVSGTNLNNFNRYYGHAVRLVQDFYTVTATCDAAQGSVSGGGTYAKGNEATLKATANEGYHFVQWSDNNTENPRTITVTADVTLAAEFTATPTALETVMAASIYAESGRIVCEGDFRIYDLLGRDVTRLNGSLQGIYVVKTADSAQKVVVK